jgi:hypothetical protein
MPGWLLNLLEFLATNLFFFAKPAKSLEQLFLFSGHQESVFDSLQKAEAKNKKEAGLSHFQDFPITACPLFETSWSVILARFLFAED